MKMLVACELRKGLARFIFAPQSATQQSPNSMRRTRKKSPPRCSQSGVTSSLITQYVSCQIRSSIEVRPGFRFRDRSALLVQYSGGRASLKVVEFEFDGY